DLDWPESIKILQRNWIGRSVGAEVDFLVGSTSDFAGWRTTRKRSGTPDRPDERAIRIFTTRPDTLFGATYLVLAPEHPLVEQVTTPERRSEVESYQRKASGRSDLERAELTREKTGVDTGGFAINPVNGEPLPIWIADYVLISYGTGAIMAVPAHDERDFEFATRFGLPIRAVVDPMGDSDCDRDAVLAGRQCATVDGIAIASGVYDGLATLDFKSRITRDLAADGLGREAVNYKLRDWLFSRQRFWGEPFPILHELDASGRPSGFHRPVSTADLPVDLPELDNFRPHGRPEPLLDKAPSEWLEPVIEGVRYKRETNTMPQWAGSCWYYLRFLDPNNDSALIDPAVERAWMPVDLYIGGAEHAVLHLLYARFWHKVLFDRGVVGTSEPFQKLVNQGMILGEIELTGYRDASGTWVSSECLAEGPDRALSHRLTGEPLTAVSVSPTDTEKRGEVLVLRSHPEIRLDSRAHKMSKSRGNVVNPDAIVTEYGADSLRLYEMFMGPLEATKPWSTDSVNGVRNFLGRVWRLMLDEHAESMHVHASVQEVPLTDAQNRVLHRTIAAVTEDTEHLRYNTAIARMMEFVNFFTKETVRPRRAMETLVLLLSPYAPHMSEELWEALGHPQTLAYEPWPEAESQWLVDAEVEVPVQIKGKVRGRILVPLGSDSSETERIARAEPRVQELLVGQDVV
ncbi:MAG TPA: leucine--tRNA ligase, partial [Pirellulaceae bacterium]